MIQPNGRAYDPAVLTYSTSVQVAHYAASFTRVRSHQQFAMLAGKAGLARISRNGLPCSKCTLFLASAQINFTQLFNQLMKFIMLTDTNLLFLYLLKTFK